MPDLCVINVKPMSAEADLLKRSYPVTGMTCASCVAHVEKAIRGTEGVEEVAVNLATNTVQVSYHGEEVSDAQLKAAVQASSYELVISEKGKSAEDVETQEADRLKELKQRLIASTALSFPSVNFGVQEFRYIHTDTTKQTPTLYRTLHMVRSSIALLLGLQLLLAGMPWSVRTHWCGGQLVGWSLLGDQPNCGMEENDANCGTDTPAIGAVPCCANGVLQVDAIPSFIKVVHGGTVVAPVATVIPMITVELPLVDQGSFDHRTRPPDIVPTGRDILVTVQRFLI